jgi:dihydroorotase
MTHELVIQGNIFYNQTFNSCCIGIDDGSITAVKKILKGHRTLSFPKQMILPTGVDTHVHFREPGMSHKETFETGSLAALHGGISCIFDMPNTIPPTTTSDRLLEKIHHAKSHSYVDFGLYVAITDQNHARLESMHPYCSGYKIYLGETTGSHLCSPSLLPTIFSTLNHSQKPILFHAEDAQCLKHHKRSERSLSDHHAARPPLCETQAIHRILSMAISPMPPVHICHVSSKESLMLLSNRPSHISCGVTPHHLLLSLDDLHHPATWYKVNPPIRPSEHPQALFQAVQNGTFDLIESDHAPHELSEKNQDFDLAPSGIAGVETMLPLFLYLASKQKCSFQQVIRLICQRPAQLTRVKKGSIVVGNDADIMVVDPRTVQKISLDHLHSKAEWTPFLDWNALFPSHVFIRGQHAIDTYELSCSKDTGNFVENRRYQND